MVTKATVLDSNEEKDRIAKAGEAGQSPPHPDPPLLTQKGGRDT